MTSPTGSKPSRAGDAQARTGQLQEVQAALLGSEYLESHRLARWPLGRVQFAASGYEKQAPGHADVFLVTHTAGAAVWECWLPAPTQPLDAARYIGCRAGRGVLPTAGTGLSGCRDGAETSSDQRLCVVTGDGFEPSKAEPTVQQTTPIHR
jgi:hypothetical protein